MTFDPEMFGRAMGEEIQKAMAPLQREIADLKRQLAERPDFDKEIADAVEAAIATIPPPKDGQDGKDCDMDAVKEFIAEYMKDIPAPADGKDGRDGADGKDGLSVTLDDVRPVIDDAVKAIQDEVGVRIDAVIKAIPTPKDGRDGVDGKDGINGEKGDPGADGAGIADLLIDREGVMVATFTDGRMKSMGCVIGKDGANGKDGADGVSLDSFEMEYLADSHEIAIKAVAGARVKEIRYPAGGLRPGGYWREGTKAKAGEAWVHDGCTWIAMKDTGTKPAAKDENWIIAARKGRDGEDGKAPPASGPVNLKG